MKTILTVLLMAVSFLSIKLNDEVRSLRKYRDEQTIIIDSLKNEVFIHQTNETRYEIARENLLIEYKECGEKYDEFLSRTE
jgi:hypothetical protein